MSLYGVVADYSWSGYIKTNSLTYQFFEKLQIVKTRGSNFSISSGVINVTIDPPTDNKMKPVWNSQLSEPKEKTGANPLILIG